MGLLRQAGHVRRGPCSIVLLLPDSARRRIVHVNATSTAVVWTAQHLITARSSAPLVSEGKDDCNHGNDFQKCSQAELVKARCRFHPAILPAHQNGPQRQKFDWVMGDYLLIHDPLTVTRTDRFCAPSGDSAS